MENLEQVARPKVVLVSDTPSFISTIKPSLQELAQVFILPCPFVLTSNLMLSESYSYTCFLSSKFFSVCGMLMR